MLQSELEDHVNNWPQNEERTYRYRLGFAPAHVVSLVRQGDLFVCVENHSTFKEYEPINPEQLLKEISSRRLIFVEVRNWGLFDPVRLRTGGCECGAIFTTEPNLHATWCYLHRRF